MGFMAGPARVEERFPGFELGVRPLLPPLEGALAVVRRLSSLGPFRRDSCRVEPRRPTRPGSNLCTILNPTTKTNLKATAHTCTGQHLCGLITRMLD